jgi:uncharacterized protein (TIGR02145 family)
VGGSSSSDGSSSSETPKCGGTVEYNPATEQCCGSNKYTIATQFCYNNSKVGDFCGINPQKSYDPDVYECKPQVNQNGIYLKAGITDSRDSKAYNAVLIGTQKWMAENLNYNATGSRCYGDNTGDDSQNRCATYGRLYNWATAMANSASSNKNPSGVQGVCPSGWHLPSDAEWDALMKVVNPSCSNGANCANAGTELKAASGWNTGSGYMAGTDDYGFSALPGGNGYSSGGSFSNANVGSYGYWWSASEGNSESAYSRRMRYNYELVSWGDYDKYYLFSVRCVKDEN